MRKEMGKMGASCKNSHKMGGMRSKRAVFGLPGKKQG